MTAPAADPAALEGLVEGALARAGVYRLLGRAFAYPTADAVAELADLAARVSAGPAGGAALAEPLGRLARAAAEADPAALADEHVFLFDRQVRCPPHEGAYGPAPPWAAGKSAQLADVAGFYQAFGLEPAAARPDTEDHVAAELEFMSALALKEAWALAEGEPEGLDVTRRAQVAFLTDHLGRFAGVFADTLRAATPLPFYLAAADCLDAWVRLEVQTLGATPVPVGERSGPDPVQEDALTCPMAAPEAPPEAPPVV